MGNLLWYLPPSPTHSFPLRLSYPLPTMNLRLPLLSVALVSLLFSSPASAGTHTNLFENFSNFDAAWGVTSNSCKLLNEVIDETAISGTDVSGWTGTGLVFEAPSCIRLGNSTTKGVVFSPVIRLSDKAITAGSATLSFHAARTAGGTTAVTRSPIVTVLNEDGSSVDGIATYSPGKLVDASSMDSLDSCYTNESGTVIQNIYSDLPETFRLRFESSNSKDGRIAIDAVLVIQDIRDTLSAPVIALSGTAGANDFAVTWNSVANAEGYSVKLLDANDNVVSSNDVTTTTASFTGLVSSSVYTVVVVALGNHTTTDDSAPATLEVTTAASAAAAPTLVVANTSWTAGVAGTSAVSATLEGNVACTFERVTMSDGSSATVANGVLSWTPPVSAIASTVTATFHITHGTEGWDLDQVLSVAATPAPAAPAIVFSNIKSRSFNALWSVSGGGPVVSYKLRAWTGRETPDDDTGRATENFEDYLSTTNVPTGWIFENSKTPYNQEDNPVDFRNDNEWIATPDYGGTITNISFRLRRQSENGSTLKVYGSTGSDDPAIWKTGENTLATLNPLVTQFYTVPIDSSKRISRVFFQYTKNSGNVSIGRFSVSGKDWPAADFLEGWGGAKKSVGAATSQTISNPVAGTTNYVEVTAVGPTGLSTSAIKSINIPRASNAVISVK